jgi:ubiquinone/menaquinone biosynthesis C-methylase UbiE
MSDIDRNAFRDFERSAHDRLADTYHAFFAPVTEHAAEPLLTAAKISAQMSVLDVACGSGVVAKHSIQAHDFAAHVKPHYLLVTALGH